MGGGGKNHACRGKDTLEPLRFSDGLDRIFGLEAFSEIPQIWINITGCQLRFYQGIGFVPFRN